MTDGTMPEQFRYMDGQLHCEEVPLHQLAAQHGTPLYVYSRAHVTGQLGALREAMAPAAPMICYSVKANPCGALLRLLAAEGAGFDVVSGGELYRVLNAGGDAGKVVFAGVGKTEEEIQYALQEEILFFTVESEPELRRLSKCAARMRRTARVALRVNPDVDPKTHMYITTGKKESKFGMDCDRARAAARMIETLPQIELVGLHMHIGSQILDVQPFAEAVRRVSVLCEEMKKAHAGFQYMDIGGGLGIGYKPGEDGMNPASFAAAVLPLLAKTGLKTVMEPGRFLVGNAGVLLASVQYVKDNAFRKFIVTDAGMNDLLRPSLYQAYHQVVSATRVDGTIHGDVVGPICESADFLAVDRELPDVREGGLVAVFGAGAYGYSMASNYNSRRRPAEVLVSGKTSKLVARREKWEDLVRLETA
jgi:diaminopimelate decarboxylase